MKHILFLCVGNSVRSQMAEGIARSLAPQGVMISSAGSNPSSVHPMAIKVLAEIGIDISSHRSKHVSEINLSSVDLVVTLCAEEVCPALPFGVSKLHWGFSDPTATPQDTSQQLEKFRKIRDELKQTISGMAFLCDPKGAGYTL
ncbi:MAG: arsenate reductase ArsC [Deltaproteobacteria bacterium]|nr:arsenate reductase ArsC [Deltaproteobacteria bacterium]